MKTAPATQGEAAPPPYRTLTGAALYLLLGPIVWAVHLTIIYSTHAVLCARGWAGGALDIRVIIAVTTGIALAISVAATIAGWRWSCGSNREGVSAFQHGVMSLLALLATIGIVYGGATALFVSPCLLLR
ncbi:MAG: hypothetical protein AB7H90_23180 [Alphaproteobacteria bacterium]